MSSTVTIFGLVAFTNSLVASCYYCIKSERRLADAKARAKALNADAIALKDDGNDVRRRNSGNDMKKNPSIIVYGLVLGVMKKQMNSIYRFVGWQRTRYHLSLVYTSLLLASLAALYSERTLRGMGINPKITAPEFCSAEQDGPENWASNSAPSSATSTLEDLFAEETSLIEAKRQLEYSTRYLEALQRDTNLYGEIEYACPMEPRTKAEFRLDVIERKGADPDGEGNAEPFFPAHCTAALELEKKRTREIECTRRICVDSTIEIEDVGVDLDSIGGVFNYIRRGKRGVVSTQTVEHDVRGCNMVTVPCPDYNKLEELDTKTRQYLVDQTIRKEHLASLKLPLVEEDREMNEGLAKVLKKGGEVVDTLAQQIDVASTAFVLYLWLSLFFPSPLYIFRSSLSVSLKRYIFGAKKVLFIVLVLAVWWGVEWFRAFSTVLEVQLYFQSLLQNPCFADITFLTNAAKSLTSVCQEISQVEQAWTSKAATIASTLQEIHAFEETCACDYPCENLCGLHMGRGAARTAAAATFGFDKDVAGNMCGSCGVDVMLLGESPSFAGNNTLCTDGSYAFGQVFASYSEMAASAGISWWSLWVSNGLLAAMLVKTFMANFAVSILRLADPMSYCGGQFEGPPKSEKFVASENLRSQSEENLRMIGLRKCIIWGFLSNLCLINMVTSAFHTADDSSAAKIYDGYILIAFSLFPVIYARRRMMISTTKIQRLEESTGKGAEGIGSDRGADVKGAARRKVDFDADVKDAAVRRKVEFRAELKGAAVRNKVSEKAAGPGWTDAASAYAQEWTGAMTDAWTNVTSWYAQSWTNEDAPTPGPTPDPTLGPTPGPTPSPSTHMLEPMPGPPLPPCTPELEPTPGPTAEPTPGPTLQLDEEAAARSTPGPTLQLDEEADARSTPGPTLQLDEEADAWSTPGPTLQLDEEAAAFFPDADGEVSLVDEESGSDDEVEVSSEEVLEKALAEKRARMQELLKKRQALMSQRGLEAAVVRNDLLLHKEAVGSDPNAAAGVSSDGGKALEHAEGSLENAECPGAVAVESDLQSSDETTAVGSDLDVDIEWGSKETDWESWEEEDSAESGHESDPDAPDISAKIEW